MKNKLFKSLLVLCLLIPMNVSAVNAKNNKQSANEVNINQLEEYILSGTGTENDPYILDTNCPYKSVLDETIDSFLQEAENIYKTASVNKKTNKNQNIDLLYDFDGALSSWIGKRENGGYWSSQSNIPSTVSDGNLWIRSICYESNAKVGALRDAKNNGTLWEIIKKEINLGKYGLGLEGAIKADALKLGWSATKKIGSFTVAEIAKAASQVFWIYYGVQLATTAINYYTYTTLKNWYKAGYGALNITYSTSYHGSWYLTNTQRAWTMYPFAYAPASCYSNGTFVSY